MADTILKLSEHKCQILGHLDQIRRDLSKGRTMRIEEHAAFTVIKGTLASLYLDEMVADAAAKERAREWGDGLEGKPNPEKEGHCDSGTQVADAIDETYRVLSERIGDRVRIDMRDYSAAARALIPEKASEAHTVVVVPTGEPSSERLKAMIQEAMGDALCGFEQRMRRGAFGAEARKG